MKYEILRYSINHKMISLVLENGIEEYTELLDDDIGALKANKTPTYGNEEEEKEGVFTCGIDGE